MRISNLEERHFYEIETYKNNWSVRELNRQFDSALYERLALSKNKEKVIELSNKGQIIDKPMDAIKDPYVLEFLNLKEDNTYSEKDLETKIINKLQLFLLELGKGFTFVQRQMRLTLDDQHFYADLVLYNRLLRCFVVIDLKIGKIKHQDIGQLQMYVNYFDRHVKTPDENKTIGILLCKEKSDAVIEMTLPKDNDQIFASKYETVLPSKEELKALIEEK
jgi:predicted nuclease of restriction endonuclease-like (RecB) superfamily